MGPIARVLIVSMRRRCLNRVWAIHPSAWEVNSANFALAALYEARRIVGAEAKRGLPSPHLNTYGCLLLFWAVVARSVLADYSSGGCRTDDLST